MIIISSKKYPKKLGEIDALFWSEDIAEEVSVVKGLSMYFKGGVGSGITGHRTFRAKPSSLRSAKSREDLPKHCQKLAIPPAWTDLMYNPDVKGDLLVTGKAKNGKTQYVYSEQFKAQQAEAKFARVLELQNKYQSTVTENQKNRKSSDLKTKENADCLATVMNTGIRAGSETDTGVEKKAFGVTTLKGEHVKEVNGVVHLVFGGKSGVSQNLQVSKADVGEMLLSRAKVAGKNGNLFDTDDSSLRKYSKTLDGGGFKTKDFRTLLATNEAEKAVKAFGGKRPTSEKEYKAMVKEVGKAVAAKLGNTVTVALQSYVYPGVFSRWRAAI